MEDKKQMTSQEAEQAIRDGETTVNELADMEEAGVVQISLAEYLEQAEGYKLSEILNSNNEKIKTFGRIIQKKIAASFEDLGKIAKQFSRLAPYFNILKEAYPEDSPLWMKPLTLIVTPANVYIIDRELEGAAPERIEQERSNYIAFFNAYYAEWLLLEEKYGDSLDVSGAHNAIWNVLTNKGLLREYEEAPMQEELDKTITLVEGYAAMLHAPGLDELPQFNPKRMEIQKHHITGRKSITSGGLTIQDESNKEIELTAVSKKPASDKNIERVFEELAKRLASVAAPKLLDVFAIQLTRQNTYRTAKPKTLIELPLTQYMELCGIPLTKPSIDKTRRTIKDLLEAFYSVSLSWEEDRDGKGKERYHLRILQRRSEIKNGIIHAQLTEDIAAYLCRAYIMQYPLSLLKVDERNPSSYTMGKRLSIQYSNLTNQQRGTADIISVKALLDKTPGIPAYEEVMAAERQLKQRIMQPFKAALDGLDFIEWEYCNAKKAPLTEEQKANFNYDTFIECYVRFAMLNAPDFQPLVAAKQEKKAATEAKRAERAAAKKKGSRGET